MAWSTESMVPYKKELILFGCLFGFGLLLLPLVVYIVGVEIVGPYEGEGGALGLLTSIFVALARGEWAAWILALSPYLVVQLTRLAVSILWRRPHVTAVTD
jgi:hypothetical protein